MTESDNIVFCKGWDIVAFTDGGPIFIHPYSIEDVPTISIRRTETGFRLGFNTNHKVRVDPVALGLDGPGFGTLVTDGYMTDNDQAVMLEVPPRPEHLDPVAEQDGEVVQTPGQTS